MTTYRLKRAANAIIIIVAGIILAAACFTALIISAIRPLITDH